jgi:hypothetical protein
MAAVGIRYWNQVQNCGDAISSYIVRDILGYDPVFVSDREEHVLCIGSIFFMAKQTSWIWGCGLLHPEFDFGVLQPNRIAAVRGTHTRQVLHDKNVGIGDIPLGDAGLLITRLPQVQQWMAEVRERGPRYKAAIVPNWAYQSRPAFRRYKDSSEHVLVDMRTTGLEPIRQIIESEVVLAQSLHGLIFGEALGKPTCWLSGNQEARWDYKYHDWYTNVRNPPSQPVDYNSLSDETVKLAELRELTVDTEALISCFPGTMAPVNRTPDFVAFDACRAASPRRITDDAIFKNGPLPLFTLPTPDAQKLGAELEKTLKGVYANWAERPYTLFSKSSWTAPENFSAFATEYMDSLRHINLLCVAPAEAVPAELPADAQIIRRGPFRILQHAGILDSAVLIRPSGPGRVTGRCDTILI